MTKAEIRIMYKHLRSGMDREEISTLSALAAERFTTADIYKSADTIMIYMPIGSEADTSAIMNQAISDGKRIALPVTSAEGDITPVYATPETSFVRGNFSIPEPAEREVASVEDIDVVIIPGIAFDRSGGRVGYGKGCYDRFLPRTNALKIGYCFEAFICDKIDTDPLDIPVDFLLTEKGLSKCR